MKNLLVRQRASRVLNVLENQTTNFSDSNTLYAIDSSNDDFYILSNNKLYKVPSNRVEDTSFFNIDENLEFISLEYCSMTQELYGACKSGSILRFNVEPEFKHESITDLSTGLQCMKLSPDHEMIVLVTADGIVITMVSTFQIISEVDLHEQRFGQKQFVTVGWGKKETQFHGSEGKKGANRAKSTEINENNTDDGSYRITWREDGSLFAVGFLHCRNQVRRFKVFNREGILLYTSEAANGLEESLSWKPSGSLIAATQISQNKHLVVFFEKNGLKHKEFSLPFKPNETRMKDLFWSPDSEILTIWCQIQADCSSVLQLWTENNYHWYLKQSIKFPMDNSLVHATWSTTSYSKKLIILTCKELITCDYNWSVDHSSGLNVRDKSVVGVIDGNKSLMTGLRAGIVPPPMAHQILETSESINVIAFAPDIKEKTTWMDSNTFFCVTVNKKLIFYRHLVDSFLLEYEHIGTYDIKWDITLDYESSFYDMHHFLWLNENNVLCSLSMNDQSFLCVLTLNAIDQTQGQVILSQTHVMDGLIQHIVPSPDSDEAYIIVDNSVVKYTRDTELVPINIELQKYTYKVEVVKISGKHVILSLYHRNCFAVNGKQIANNITSFFVHSEFLLLTTAQNTLVCVHLNESDFEELMKQDLTVKPWENELNDKSFLDTSIRRLERGCQLIAAIPKDSKTVLQMPRGNLECIQPRTLSLHIIGYHLDNCDYLSAFDLMRRQRINLNLIYDHNPKKFIENANTFVDQISKVSWLSLFLSELTDEDVTMTIYANYYRRHRSESNNLQLNKIELICGLLRNIMEERNSANHLIQPILISLVKDKRKQGMEAALTKIKEIQKLEEKCTENKECISDEALKYLLYIVDVNVLFDIALGMYDFDLTMFIASKSQKDPKEYIPFLNDLRNLDENYMKYSIDLHLKRYESALEHIAKESNRFNEAVSLICNRNLYTKALKLYEKESKEYKEVARIYGEFLLKKQCYHEAGVMFRRSGDLKEALNAYKLATSWRDVIILSTQMELSEAEKDVIHHDLVKCLETDKRHEEAAYIFMNYLGDTREATISLCNGKQWKDALRIAHDTNNLELIESHIKPSVYEYADHVLSQIRKNKQDFEQHKSRLATVRRNISQRNAKSYNEILCDNESIYDRGISDILSDTSSVVGSTLSQISKSSITSGKSYRSSKNRRKQERKLLSLKEGSVFEDLALIQTLYQIISNTYKEQNDVHILIQMLVHFDDDEYAKNIQNCMEELLLTIEKSKSEIWDKSAPSSLTEMENADVTTGSQGFSVCYKLLESYIVRPPIVNTSPWKVNIF